MVIPRVPLRIAVFLFSIASIAPGQAPADDPQVSVVPRKRPLAAELPRATFKLDVKLIQVPVQVTDMRGSPVMGLKQDNFRLFEDDQEQQVVSFAMADAPISVGLVFDASGSMQHRLEESRKAVEQFLMSSGPEDEFSLVRFSDRPEMISAFTHDQSRVLSQLNLIKAHGWTAMIDAIWLSIQEMRRATCPRKAILLLSDGGDNNSRYSEGELLSLLREADVRLFAIGLFQRSRYLEKLADETGGKVIWVHRLGDLPDAMETLSRQIHNEYLLGYFSDHAKDDGRYHKLRVDVRPPAGTRQVQVSWRHGYTAP